MNFVLTRANTIGSLAIRARLRDGWSHGVVMTGTGSQIIDATFKYGGVRERRLLEVLEVSSAKAIEFAPLDREREAEQWLRDQVGKGYDWRAVFGWAGAGRDWHDDYAWFCFELIAAQIEIGSSYRFENRNRVTGRDLIHAARVLRGQA